MSIEPEPLEPRLAGYLRSRAAGDVPPDLLAVARLRIESEAGERSLLGRRLVAFGTVAAVLAVVGAAFALGVGSRPPASASPLAAATPSVAVATPSDEPSSIGGAFPTSIDGMPVQTVAQARALLETGDINGRAIAVGGYFYEFYPSCPGPRRAVGPLEGYCRMVAFTDTEESAQLCHPYGSDGVSCAWTAQGVPSLRPFLMPETSGADSRWGSNNQHPRPLVLIGHARDPRAWQCWPDTQVECTAAFVVDRVAWANGQDVAIAVPQPYDDQSGTPLSPTMSLDDVTQALAAEDRVLAAGAFRARDVWTVDPRFNLTGEGLVWIVRTLSPIANSADPTRGVEVSVVDDATARVLGTADLDVGADYAPGRLWIEGLRDTDAQGNEPDDMRPFFEVETSANVLLHQGRVSGGASATLRTLTYGPGSPVLLDPGTYSITSWLATFNGGQIGQPVDECSMEITVVAAQDTWLAADFRGTQPSCTFHPFTPDNPR